MTPEDHSPLRITIDELKRVIAQCLGDDHESKGVLAQIERTIANIERKAKTIPVSDIANAVGTSESFSSTSNAASASMSMT
jgi:adenylosuccinate lyase